MLNVKVMFGLIYASIKCKHGISCSKNVMQVYKAIKQLYSYRHTILLK